MKSLKELEKIREEAKAMMSSRSSGEGYRIVVGMATCGIAAGARDTLQAIMDELNKRSIDDVSVTQTGCIGLCEKEPIVEVINPDGKKVTYSRVNEERGRQIVARHIVNGNMIGDWVLSRE